MSKAVPEGWEKSILGKEIRLIKGSLAKDLYDQKKEGMIPYLLIESFNSGQSRYVYPTGMSLCKEEDPVLVMDGSRSGLVLRGKSGVIGSTLASILPSEPSRLDKGYLFYILDSLYKLLNKSKTSGAVPHVDRTLLLNIPIFLPPPHEQQKISTILSSVGTAIEKAKSVIEQTKIVKKGLMQELFTKGIPGRHKKFKKTPIGEVPEDWEVVRLEDVAKVQTGIAKNKNIKPENGVILPYLRVANVQDGFVDLSEVKHISVDESDVKRYLLQKGDILFTEGGDNDKLGRGCVWEAQLNPCLHQNHIFAVRCSSSIFPYYLSLYAASSKGKEFFLNSSKQTTNLASINATQLKSFPLPLPSFKEQIRIASILNSISNIELYEDSYLKILSDIKSALMQYLFTGELRVKI